MSHITASLSRFVKRAGKAVYTVATLGVMSFLPLDGAYATAAVTEEESANPIAQMLDTTKDLFSSLTGTGAKDAHFLIKDYIAAETTNNTGVDYRRTASALFDQPLYNTRNEEIGVVEDVLVDKNDGSAKMVVFSPKGSQELYWEKVDQLALFTPPAGDAATGVDATDAQAVKAKAAPKTYNNFKYDLPDMSNYLSLRRLNEGQVMDMDGKFVGNIDAVMYQKGDARHLIFMLNSGARGTASSIPFYLPFDKAVFRDNPESGAIDIALNEEQTRAVAETFFEKADAAAAQAAAPAAE